jgi:hypothetical protein
MSNQTDQSEKSNEKELYADDDISTSNHTVPTLVSI